jgi:hypothetical protein
MKDHAHKLANCLLKIECDQVSQYIALRSPVADLDPIALSFDHDETSISLSDIHNWPKTRVVLDVPAAAEQLAAAKGYAIEGRRTEVVRIVTEQIDWPDFELTLNPVLKQITLRLEWQLLRSFQGSNRLGQAAGRLQEDEKALVTRRGVMERRQKGSGITKIDYDRLQADIDKINNMDIPDIHRKKAILAAVQNGLDRMKVPFLITMEVDQIPVLIAKSRD